MDTTSDSAEHQGQGSSGSTGDYQLVCQFPRRVLTRPAQQQAGVTLQDLGLSGQEMFLLEPV